MAACDARQAHKRVRAARSYQLHLHRASLNNKNKTKNDSDEEEDYADMDAAEIESTDVFEPLWGIFGAFSKGCGSNHNFRRARSRLNETPYVPPCFVTEDGHREWSF